MVKENQDGGEQLRNEPITTKNLPMQHLPGSYKTGKERQSLAAMEFRWYSTYRPEEEATEAAATTIYCY